ncbi:hypothetical protein [Arthrobacter sp. CJ23]|uniref:hypothetical protein n=1 Tax=Arthrobacter sp. CJ23 TaxID=2972479 RepID=UPI00215BF370|nr:hypothetical protein [Arthrobacter sp. CJ23]UVJ40243.1 hypothetical protein NVV90_03385 [Arthrobacter sp. CJ23]
MTTEEDRSSERKDLIEVVEAFGRQAPARHRGDLPKGEQALLNAGAQAAQDRLAEMAREDKAAKHQP